MLRLWRTLLPDTSDSQEGGNLLLTIVNKPADKDEAFRANYQLAAPADKQHGEGVQKGTRGEQSCMCR